MVRMYHIWRTIVREIDYKKIIINIDEMTNVLEYDAMRSAGKMKINADTLLHLHSLKDIYLKKLPTKAPKKKEVKNG